MKLISARHRPWVAYAAYSLLSLGVMTSNLRGGIVADRIEILVLHILAPVYSSVDWLLNSAQSTWDNYLNLVDVETRKQRSQRNHSNNSGRTPSTDRPGLFHRTTRNVYGRVFQTQSVQPPGKSHTDEAIPR